MAPVCAVCSQPTSGSYWTTEEGRAFCGVHRSMPRCHFCGLPTKDEFGGVPRCRYCAVTGVDDIDTAIAHFSAVRLTLEGIGLRVRSPVKVFLRDKETWLRSGHFESTSTPIGKTFYWRRSGRVTISIGLVAGLPAARFQGCVAHEWGHVFEFDRAHTGRSPLPKHVTEGFAQYVEYIFLTKYCTLAGAHAYAESQLRDPDPVYGAGLRAVKRAVERHGSKAVTRAVTSGRLKTVGL